MSDPILPAPVASRHRSSNNTTSSATTQQPQPPSPSSSSEIKPIIISGSTSSLSGGGGVDAPYEYPATHPPKFPVGSYLSYVKRVAANSPILQAVFRPCLNPDKVDVMILDIKKDWSCSKPYIFGDSKSIDEYFGPDPPEPRGKKLGYSSLVAFLELPKPADVFVRLFLVEDLSPAMIEALGSVLNIDPNFFAEQIVGTNYTLKGYKDPVEIRDAIPTMPFLLKQKTFFSWIWKRSALHSGWNNGSPDGSSFPINNDRGLNKRSTEDEDNNSNSRQYNNMHRPHDAIGEHLMSKEAKTAVAVEERISFLRKADGHGWTGVFLFDPVKELPHTRENALHGYNYRNIQSIPSYLDFSGSGYTPEYVNNPRTRNQVVGFITKVEETIIKHPETRDEMNIESSSAFLSLLFHFMVNDWNSVLREMDRFLDEVDTLMSDNNMLQKKLVTWRIILGAWRKNLVDDSEKIRTTLLVIEQHDLKKFYLPFKEMLVHVESLKDRTERTFGALMSSMAIVESQRAISQAESISRLTELAFLFIPLGFATSTFGMQLQGWSENYKPSQFIILSVCLVFGSYLFRIVVRSRASQHVIELVPDRVRENSGLSPGMHIPTLDYAIWFTKRSWKVILLVALSAMSLALIWSLGQSRAVQIGTTVMVCAILGVGLGGIFYISHRRRRDIQVKMKEWHQLQDNRRQAREATRYVDKTV